VKLLFREPGKLVLRFSKREYETLLTILRLRPLFPRRSRPIASDGDGGADEQLRTAQADLDAALAEHRDEQIPALEALLADPERCLLQPGDGWQLTLNDPDAEMLLQALNEIRFGAWEKLGRPGGDTGEGGQPAELTQENFLALWAFQVGGSLQGALLEAMTGEDE
jgi:hypothetical protein